jgi:hypothetical protein
MRQRPLWGEVTDTPEHKMPKSPTALLMEAADHVTSLVKACEQADLETDILERSTKVRISSPLAHERMAEIITLRPDESEVLTWYWSWEDPICPAQDTEALVQALLRVVTIKSL